MISFQSAVFRNIPNLLPADNIFLQRIFAQRPDILAGFTDFATTPTIDRIPKAAKILERLPRTGWKRLDIAGKSLQPVLITHGNNPVPKRWFFAMPSPRSPETVMVHTVEAGEIYIAAFPESAHLQMGLELMKFHDFAEAVFGDLTPHDSISREDKKRLELLALNLLTAGRLEGNLVALHVYNCVRIFDGHVTNFLPLAHEMQIEISKNRAFNGAAPHQEGVINFFQKLYSEPIADLNQLRIQANDADLLQMAYRGIRIIVEQHSNLPREDALQKINEFHAYVAARVKTPIAKAIAREFSAMIEFDWDVPLKVLLKAALEMARLHH